MKRAPQSIRLPGGMVVSAENHGEHDQKSHGGGRGGGGANGPKAKLSIRSAVYREKEGFSIVGKDSRGRKVKVFAETREAADHIRDKIASGGEITPDDFKAGGGKVDPDKYVNAYPIRDAGPKGPKVSPKDQEQGQRDLSKLLRMGKRFHI